jgi:hypothetical protein
MLADAEEDILAGAGSRQAAPSRQRSRSHRGGARPARRGLSSPPHRRARRRAPPP